MATCFRVLYAALLMVPLWAQGQPEIAFPLTASLQSPIPPSGLPAESYYLPGSSDITCFEATPSGNRFLCLSNSGTILEWTADGRIRQVAEGFIGPLRAKAAEDGTLYVLDLGNGTLHMINRDGTVTRLMGSGGDRVIKPALDPRIFDLPYYVLSRDFYQNSVQMAIDPQGSLYLGIAREETTRDSGSTRVRRFLYILRLDNRGAALSLYWDGSAQLANAASLPSFDALSVNRDRTFFFSLNGQLARLTSGLQFTELRDGPFTPLRTNPVRGIVQTGDGNIFLHSSDTDAIFRLAFAELRVDLNLIARLNGMIARQGTQMVALDREQNRLLRFTPDTTRIFVGQEAGRLLRYLPVTGNTGFRAAFDFPISVSADSAGPIYVVEREDGSVYRIAANGVLSRVARSIFNPDSTTPYVFRSENIALDQMPYPVTSVVTDRAGRLYMLDSDCNFFVQTDTNIARRAVRLAISGGTGCRLASMVVDLNGRFHIATPGGIVSGMGEATAGEWTFSNTYSGNTIRSISLLPSGDLLVLEGPTPANWSLKRLNTNTRVATVLTLDDSLRNVNLRLTSIAADFSNRILAITCCTTGSTRDAGKPFLFQFTFSAADRLSGQPRNVAFFDGPGQAPEILFTHPRGALLRTNANRIYYLEDAQVRATSGLNLPNRQTWTYLPDSGLQELAIPVSPAFGPTAFRTRLACNNDFGNFVRVGPHAAIAPTQLRLSLDTLNAPSRAASCRVEALAVNSDRIMASTTVDMTPDAARLAQIPSIALLDQFTPFLVDPKAGPAVRRFRVVNNTPAEVEIRVDANLPDGIAFEHTAIKVLPKYTAEFVFTIQPDKLFRQHYLLPIRINCADCRNTIEAGIAFQIAGRTTSIDISAEAVLVDGGALAARNTTTIPGASLLLAGLQENDITIRPDFGQSNAWFTVRRTRSSRLDDGRLALAYDIVLDRSALPARQTSTIVSFEAQAGKTAARRFLTVFYFPEGTVAQRLFETDSAGATVNLTASPTTVQIPVFSRSDAAVPYSTYTLGGAGGAFTVPPSQGLIVKGSNSLMLDVIREGTLATLSESKDIVILFGNGEKLIYTLHVVASAAQPADSKETLRSALGTCSGKRLLLTPREPGLPYTVVRNVGQKFTLEVKDECNQSINASDGGQLKFTTEPANGTVTVTSVGNGLWDVFWKPERSGTNFVTKYVALRGVSEREIYTGSLTVDGRVIDSAVPSLNSFSIVDAISLQPKSFTAPGAFITIFGENLATASITADGAAGQYPTTLGGVQVEFNGKAVPLLLASPGQVNAQVPFDLVSGEYRMLIRRGDLVSAPAGLGVGSASPAIATVDSSGKGQGHIYRIGPDGAASLAAPGNGAKEGEQLVIFATGLGATNPYYVEGKTVDTSERIGVASNIQAVIGSQVAPVTDAVLAQGFIGVYLVTTAMPPGVQPGDSVLFLIRADGVDSQSVTMAAQ